MDWILFSIMLFEVKLLLKRGQFLFVFPIVENVKTTFGMQAISFTKKATFSFQTLKFNYSYLTFLMMN
jgi:hypothetical protein